MTPEEKLQFDDMQRDLIELRSQVGKLQFPTNVQTQELINRDRPKLAGDFTAGTPTNNGHVPMEINGIRRKFVTTA